MSLDSEESRSGKSCPSIAGFIFRGKSWKCFLYHQPTGAITYQVLGVSLQRSSSFAVLHPDYILWDEPICFYLKKSKLLNNFNRCLRGKSLQCSLLSSTRIAHAMGTISGVLMVLLAGLWRSLKNRVADAATSFHPSAVVWVTVKRPE